MPAIQLTNVSKWYGTNTSAAYAAVSAVTLAVPAGKASHS